MFPASPLARAQLAYYAYNRRVLSADHTETLITQITAVSSNTTVTQSESGMC